MTFFFVVVVVIFRVIKSSAYPLKTLWVFSPFHPYCTLDPLLFLGGFGLSKTEWKRILANCFVVVGFVFGFWLVVVVVIFRVKKSYAYVIVRNGKTELGQDEKGCTRKVSVFNVLFWPSGSRICSLADTSRFPSPFLFPSHTECGATAAHLSLAAAASGLVVRDNALHTALEWSPNCSEAYFLWVWGSKLADSVPFRPPSL